ncbi:MAG TPA: nicotinamide-nucleotide amidohydrolase family protein [bacterium]|nr:nicotinamide-nucleotide amidohydrolase family protein [bacterium]
MNRTAVNVKELFVKKRLTLAVAESCTGGLIASLLTDVPGSSGYFAGGVIAYANAVKEELLGVRPATLRASGAVSERTAREMADGARRLCSANVAVAVTGIAGPGGGTPRKPVGLVYVALSCGKRTICEKHLFRGGRLQVKKKTAGAALKLVEAYGRAHGNPA